MEICSIEKCTGCGLCSAICPRKCISMEENNLGHIYPKINDDLCLKCGGCIKGCPANNEVSLYSAQNVFACWSKNEYVRSSSTSGGLATTLGRFLVANGYIAYGSAFENNKIHHIRVETEEDVYLLQGSKYVESPIFDVLPLIKKDLEEGNRIVFFGTPCQCAAVSMLSQRYRSSIVVIELICTGVPPQKLLWESLHGYECTKIRFRDEIGTRLTLWNGETIVYQKPVWKNKFLMGFSKHLYLRDSCYACQYASLHRNADITLGDYWGLSKEFRDKHDVRTGVSVVFINSSIGSDVFDLVKGEIECYERPLEEAITGNPRYSSPSKAHKDKERFKDDYNKRGFEYAINHSMVNDRTRYFVYSVKRAIKDTLLFLLKH